MFYFGIFETFRKKSIGKQLNFLFILSSMLICSVLIIITKFQLDWLSSNISHNTENIINDRALKQMKALSLIEARYIESELSNYIQFISIMKNSAEIFHNFSANYDKNPFKRNSIHFHTEFAVKSFKYPAYYSKRIISSKGYDLIYNESCYNKIWPSMYSTDYLGYYNGFFLDEIFYGYPGKIRRKIYTPLVREWFYKAINNKNNLTITEPYRDFTTQSWVISISKTIIDDNDEIYGVSALDITLKKLSEKLKKLEVSTSTFALLISNGGVLINTPKFWGIGEDVTVRIFDEYITGISEEDWNFVKGLESGSIFKFLYPNGDYNGIDYTVVVQKMMPEGTDKITHYLLFCSKTTQLTRGKKFANEVINGDYKAVFFISLAVGLCMFVIISILIYIVASSYGKKLKTIELLYKSLLDRGLFKGIGKNADFFKLEKKSQGIELIAKLTIEKIKKLENKEIESFFPTNNFTRPYDFFLFSDWNQFQYPHNKYNEHQFEWKKCLEELERIF